MCVGLSAKVVKINDELKELENDTQKITDKYIAKIDGAVEEKTKEILTV